MKKYIIFYLGFTLILISLFTYYGCSELEKNLIQAPTSGIVHGTGWVDKASQNFHGVYIVNQLKWKLDECQKCHGSDYKGGSTGISCLTCHTNQGGPEACNTCHGSRDTTNPHPYPPLSLKGDSLETDRGVGVHNLHLTDDPNERYSAQVRCVSCHQKVNSFSDPSHFQNPNGVATLHFDSLAVNVLPGDTISRPNPTYDVVSNTCSNVYCHGQFTGGNLNFKPVFNDPESVTCGSCHGDPVTGNPTPRINGVFRPPHYSWMTINNCYYCHTSVINQQGQIIDPTKHVNGVVNGQ